MKTSLQKIFDTFAKEADLVINQTDSAGTKWQVTRATVLQKDGKGKETKPKVVKGTLNKPFNIAIMYPENLIAHSYDLTKEDTEMLFSNYIITTTKEVFFVDTLEGGKALLSLSLPKDAFQNKVTTLPDCLLDLEPEEYSCRLCSTKQKIPMLELTKGDETLRVALMQGSKPEKVSFSFLDKQINLLDWDDATKSYKTIKEAQMFEPPALPKLNKKSKAVEVSDVPMLEGLEEVTEDIADSVVDNILAAAGVAPKAETTAVMEVLEEAHVDVTPKTKAQKPGVVKEAPKEEPIKEEPKEDPIKAEPKEEPVKETPKEAEPVVEEKAPEVQEAKKSRTPRLKKKLQDLSNIIEALRTDPPETMSVDDGLNEIRQLRELIKMASCRMANVATLTIDSSRDKINKAEEAQKKLEEISCLLSQKK